MPAREKLDSISGQAKVPNSKLSYYYIFEIN